jgi:hypothetical protein
VSGPQGVNERIAGGVESSRRCVAAVPEDVIDRGTEIIQPGARDDDRVAPAVTLLGDAQESSTLVLAEFEMKSLPFDLNFPRLENAVHLKTHLSLANSFAELEGKCTRVRPCNLFGGSGF